MRAFLPDPRTLRRTVRLTVPVVVVQVGLMAMGVADTVMAGHLSATVLAGVALGATREAMAGLSGLGDLILTASSPQSRNMSLGRALGQGQRLEDILGERRAVTEGVYTARAVVSIATAHGIEVPISEAVRSIVDDGLAVDQAIAELMRRPLRAETEDLHG